MKYELKGANVIVFCCLRGVLVMFFNLFALFCIIYILIRETLRSISQVAIPNSQFATPNPKSQIAIRNSSLFYSRIKIIPLIIRQDESRHIFDYYLPDSLHAKLGILEDLDLLDAVLRQARRWPADASEVEAAVLLAGGGDLWATVALGHHDQGAALSLEIVHVGVHAPGGGGAEAAARHPLRGLGGPGVVHGVILEVLR